MYKQGRRGGQSRSRADVKKTEKKKLIPLPTQTTCQTRRESDYSQASRRLNGIASGFLMVLCNPDKSVTHPLAGGSDALTYKQERPGRAKVAHVQL